MKEITDYYTARAAACNVPEDKMPNVLRVPTPLLSEEQYISFTSTRKEAEDTALEKYQETIKAVGVFAVTCAYKGIEAKVGNGRQKAVTHITDLLDPQPSRNARNGQGRTGRVRNLALQALRPCDVPETLHLPAGLLSTDELSLETGAVLLALTGEHVVSNGRFQRAVGRLLLVQANNTHFRPEATQYVVDVRSFTNTKPEPGNHILRLRTPEAGIVPTA